MFQTHGACLTACRCQRGNKKMTMTCSLLFFILGTHPGYGSASTSMHGSSMRSSLLMPLSDVEERDWGIEYTPIESRAPLSLSPLPPLSRPADGGCYTCKAPLLPLAVSASHGRKRQQLHHNTLHLVRRFVGTKGSRDSVAGRFAEDMMQQRLNRFFPNKLDLRRLRSEEATAVAKAASLGHLLSVRRDLYHQYGPDVAVHPYYGDPLVRFSIMWRLAPDDYQICNETGENVSVTRLAFQPVHEKIDGPLWQMLLQNATDEDWNPNAFRRACGSESLLRPHACPEEHRVIPNPEQAVDLIWTNFMQHLGLKVRLGWIEDKGDGILLHHMQAGHFGVARPRNEYEEYMDARGFSHLLYRVSEAAGAGNASVEDAVLVIERMVEAGLEPTYQDICSLMSVAVGAARHGCESAVEEVEYALEVVGQVFDEAVPGWVYLVALEAVAWAARHGTADLHDAEAILCRIADPYAAAQTPGAMEHESSQMPHTPHTHTHTHTLPSTHMAHTPHAQPAGCVYKSVLEDADLYACLLAVVAGVALSGCKDEDRMNVGYQEDEDGMVVASPLPHHAQPLTYHLHGCHMMERMEEGHIAATAALFHARLQLAVGSAMRGELSMPHLDTLLHDMCKHRIGLEHMHAHSLLAAAVLALEAGNLSIDELGVLVDYIWHAGLDLDALSYSLWLRGIASTIARANASIPLLLHVMDEADEQGFRFSPGVLRLVGEAVGAGVSLMLRANNSVEAVIGLRESVSLVLSQLLYLGASPPKALFHARLLLLAEVIEAGSEVWAYEARQSTGNASAYQAHGYSAVSGYEAESTANDMITAGEAPDGETVSLMLRVVTAAVARAEMGVEDAARIIERALAAGLVPDEAMLLQTLAAAEAGAEHGQVSLADGWWLVGRLGMVSATVVKKATVLAALLRVAAAAAQHGLATVDEALVVAEALLNARREAGVAARLEPEEREALVQVLGGAATLGHATGADAERVLGYVDVPGSRPSLQLLNVLLDLVLVEAARGKATVADAAHIIGRMRGCGFASTYLEKSKLLSIVHASALHGGADMTDALDALAHLQADAPPLTEHYLQVLDCGQWAALSRSQAAASLSQPCSSSSASSGGTPFATDTGDGGCGTSASSAALTASSPSLTVSPDQPTLSTAHAQQSRLSPPHTPLLQSSSRQRSGRGECSGSASWEESVSQTWTRSVAKLDKVTWEEWASQTWTRMEQLIEAAAGTGGGGVDLRQEPRAVAICARFARHTRHGQAVLGAWHMFRTLEPRLRTHLVYEEIMGALAAVGNKEGVMGLVRVASKHGLHPSPAMLLAASAAATQDTQDHLHVHHTDMTEESQST